jgi:hypothetical protein
VLRWTPHLHAHRLVPGLERETTLLSGIRQVTFAYFRPPAGRDPAGWVSVWQGVDPPELVRVHIAFETPSRHWPDVIVAPMCEANND